MSINDPKTYRQLSEPIPAEEIDKSLAGFVDELRAIRLKYKILDVYCIVAGNSLFNGDEGRYQMSMFIGDASKRESMAALAFGFESTARQAAIQAIAADASRKSIKRREPK